MQHLSKDLKHTIYGHTTDDALMRLMCVSKSDNAIAAGVLAMRVEMMKPAKAMFVEMLNKLREKFKWRCFLYKPNEFSVDRIKDAEQWNRRWEYTLRVELKKPGIIEVSMNKDQIMMSVDSGDMINLGGDAWTKTFFPHAKTASILVEKTHMRPHLSYTVAEVFQHAKTASIVVEKTHTRPYPSDPVAEVCETFGSDEESELSEEYSDDSDSE